MDFHYRYVGYGSTFVAAKDARTSPDPADSDKGAKTLAANELAVDVGGRCFSYDSESMPIFDHHFQRDAGQFPSAAAAVLHHASEIHRRFHNLHAVWLTAHRDPDFDALCAMYLARQIISGIIPHDNWEHFGLRADGWFNQRGEVEWFAPKIVGMPLERAWPILLAAYASRVDQARRLSCPRDRSLHGILYAAVSRGRDVQKDGAWELFEAARRAICKRGLNPLYDSLLEKSKRFAPELALLDRENAAYGRDLVRARHAIVYLRDKAVNEWYSDARKRPVFEPSGQVNPEQLALGQGKLRQADGIYLRDPECVLFKEWARSDVDNSPGRQGFLFTAIAYSSERRQAAINSSNYYFSLDPERCGDAHLYNAWVDLQVREALAIRQADGGKNGSPPKDGKARNNYEDRASGFEHEFTDPWFDGGNYNCTIIATPNGGSGIGAPGTLGDLTDDLIAMIVRDTMELAVFEGDAVIRDIPPDGDKKNIVEQRFPVSVARMQLTPADPARFRFVSVAASDDVNLENPPVAEQMGKYLWQLLTSDKSMSVPEDFVQRHLVVEHSSVGVWSRKGIAIAYQGKRGAEAAAETGDILRALVSLAGEAEKSLKLERKHRLAALDRNLGEAVTLKQKLALPDFRILSRFYEASRLDEVLSASHNLDASYSMNKALEELTITQKKVEWVEVFLIAVYATELARAVIESFESGQMWTGWAIVGLAFLAMPAAFLALDLHRDLKELKMLNFRWKRYIGILAWFILFFVLLITATITRNRENAALKEPAPTTQGAK